MALNQLNKILEELDSLFELFESIQDGGEDGYTSMYMYNKPESYSFIYNRLGYLSEKLNSIGRNLNSTSILNESEQAVLPPR
jgi:hypothetical protein